MILKIDGKIDSNNAQAFEEKLLGALKEDKDIDPVLDAEDLLYISSAGLRVLMKARKALGRPFSVINLSPEVYEIFETTGFTDILDVSKKPREITLEGCEIIGKGFYGTVYRIDEDTIVKMYNSPDAISMIKNEKKMAKMAFVKGIPTAISFDIVSSNGCYGSVFELLKSKSFNDMIVDEPDRVDEIVRMYTGFMKEVHQTVMDPGTLPYARDRFIYYLDTIVELLDADTADKCRKLIEAVPDDLHVVHGDIQMKNVMMSDNEPVLIDMDTLSIGQPIFDLQGLYVTYMAFEEDEEDNSIKFLGIETQTCAHIWDLIIRDYYGITDEEKLKVITDKIRLLAYIRFLHIININQDRDSELGQIRIKHGSEHLRELVGRIDDLMIP
ncbi:MAG TPA: hypothetical protein DIS78_08475 [Lachnospiraceae bacterium]|nr:hypothetical protein [Lachnospiraceae bacterium]